LSVKRSEIATAALSILQETEPDTATIGNKWLKHFLDRHPEYRVRRHKSLDIKRLRTHTKKSIEEWFESLQRMIKKYGIQPKDIYNFDEIGF
jgi:hypothetical protein